MKKKYENPIIKTKMLPEENIALIDILSILGEQLGEASGDENDSWEEQEW